MPYTDDTVLHLLVELADANIDNTIEIWYYFIEFQEVKDVIHCSVWNTTRV